MGERTCEGCGEVLPADRSMCPSCGRLNRSAEAWTPPERRGAMMAPPPVRTQGDDEGGGRRAPRAPITVPGEIRNRRSALVAWGVVLLLLSAIAGVAYAVTRSSPGKPGAAGAGQLGRIAAEPTDTVHYPPRTDDPKWPTMLITDPLNHWSFTLYKLDGDQGGTDSQINPRNGLVDYWFVEPSTWLSNVGISLISQTPGGLDAMVNLASEEEGCTTVSDNRTMEVYGVHVVVKTVAGCAAGRSGELAVFSHDRYLASVALLHDPGADYGGETLKRLLESFRFS